MNLGGDQVVNKQSMMPGSSGASWKSTAGGGGGGGGDGGVPDQFPAGLRVLVVDDDRTCLKILEQMLRRCNYEVTKCNTAEVALSFLRENKNGFDIVISDVHMPDMDGFKLLEHIGIEMDLPVILISADDRKNLVMKGVTHGACDYLVKPVHMEELRNIWHHVVRKRKHVWKDFEPSASADEQKPPEEPDHSSSANEGHNWKNTKRKDEDDDAEERDDSSSFKKPQVVWSVELQQQFVAVVNQLGIDKAVPKKILELMNVPGLTRENVASHLQIYHLYLRRLSRSQHPGDINTGFTGSPDAGYGSILSLNGLDIQALTASGQLGQLPPQSLATPQAAALGRSNNSKIKMSSLKDFEHLRICLEDIKLATNNFDDNNYINRGGFGNVYKGELVHSGRRFMVAVKRLDKTLGQGAPEFWKEIMMLSCYKHENLVSLFGFSDEGGEYILVYEYLPNKSLDMHLSSTKLSWIERLNICIGAARGLEHLHNPGGTTHRVLHRDIKSSNILLDENWNAKISDFGLSKFGPVNPDFTFLISHAAGTPGYCDPLYMGTGFLTKESDVYSFGVVLFEVLCGRRCIEYDNDGRQFLSKLAQSCYEEKKIGTIVLDCLQEQISPCCLDKFSTIAYQCLREDRNERPTIAEIVKQLETVLRCQASFILI